MSTQTFSNVGEAINKYYKLKHDYEVNFKNKYVVPILNSNISEQEKKVKFNTLGKKPECINCKRNVSSIFKTIPSGKEGHRILTAKCGDIQNPCPFNVNIIVGDIQPYANYIDLHITHMNQIKNEIICEQNNWLFGYKSSSEASETFNKLKEELVIFTKAVGIAIEENILKTDSPEKIQTLKSLQIDLETHTILFKNYIAEYNKSNDMLFIKDAISFYLDTIIPISKQIRTNKYKVNFVDFNQDTEIYTLVQKLNSIQNSEVLWAPSKINTFVLGVMSKAKTLKTTKLPKLVKTSKQLIISDDVTPPESTEIVQNSNA